MLSLRQRRRLQTAREIQRATLRLAGEHGLDGFTTEAVSREAGISVRTFFNYYPNKESAIFGPPPKYPDEAVKEFVAAKGTLSDDLKSLMTAHLQEIREDRDILVAIRALECGDPRLHRQHMAFHIRIQSDTRELLQTRLPRADPLALRLLADLLIVIGRNTLDIWVADEDLSIEAALDRCWVQLGSLLRLMSDGDPAESAGG